MRTTVRHAVLVAGLLLGASLGLPRPAVAQSGEPPRHVVRHADGSWTVAADGVGQRQLLAEVARAAGFPVVFEDDLPDSLITFKIEAPSAAQVVGALLDATGINYVLRRGEVDHADVALAVIAVRDLGAVNQALAQFDAAKAARMKEQQEKIEAVARDEATRGRFETPEDAQRALEASLRMEGETVEPAVDSVRLPPQTIELGPAPERIILNSRPTTTPLAVTVPTLPVAAEPASRAVTPADMPMPKLATAPRPPG